MTKPKTVVPPSAAASVFQLHAANKAASSAEKRRERRRGAPAAQPVDPTKLEVKAGIPVPSARTAVSPWRQLAHRMGPGDMVEVPCLNAADNLRRELKALGYPIATRKLDNGAIGVWRLAKEEQQ